MCLEILHWYFKGRLEELSTIMGGEFYDDESQDKDEMDLDEKSKISYRTGEMDIDECSHQGKFLENNKLVKNIGKVVRDLRSLGFTSMTEDAYSSAIFLLLKVSMCSIFAIPVQLISFHLYIGIFLFISNIVLLYWTSSFPILYVRITSHIFFVCNLSLGPIKIFLCVWQAKVHDLAGDDYRSSVLESIKGWIQVFFLVCVALFF